MYTVCIVEKRQRSVPQLVAGAQKIPARKP